MRAAAILGLGSSIRDLKPFQNHHPEISWSLGLPAYGTSDIVLIFGGDGTVHRHLAALVKLALPVLVVPRGSGNDFARALGIESVQDALCACQRFVTGQSTTRCIDLGSIEPLPAGTRSGRNQHVAGHIASKHYFCCVAGAGLDAAVTRLANRLPPWLRAHGGYALSLPVGLACFDPCHVTVLQESAADPNAFTKRYAQPALLAAVANTPTYGGGMRIAPRAALEDGLLDVCIVGKIPKFKLLALFPTVYRGRHLGIKRVDYFQVKGVRIQTPRPIDVYADGEYVCQTPVQVSVVPHALSVIAPQTVGSTDERARTTAAKT
jgi:diacylglycerol kinase (ATP)